MIFALQSASAGFAPTFQATIPEVLPDKKDYTRALSLSRLAYDLESLAFGGGSMVAALALPRLLEQVPDRTAMLAGATLRVVGTLLAAALPGYGWLLPLWFVLGIGCSTAQTPSGRLLRRSAKVEDLTSLFAAQFALSHACWLFAYPFAGWAGATLGLSLSATLLAVVAGIAAVMALVLWPCDDTEVVEHNHDELHHGPAHLKGAQGRHHAHPYEIDGLHPNWSTRG